MFRQQMLNSTQDDPTLIENLSLSKYLTHSFYTYVNSSQAQKWPVQHLREQSENAMNLKTNSVTEFRDNRQQHDEESPERISEHLNSNNNAISISCHDQISSRLNSILNQIEHISPSMLPDFHNIVHLIMRDLEKQNEEIARLNNNLRREREIANNKLLQIEEEAERELAKREENIRKEERSRYERILADIEANYQKLIQAKDHNSAEINRANWANKKNPSGSTMRSSTSSEEMSDLNSSATVFRGIEKELEDLKNTLANNIVEIKSTKELLSKSLFEQNEMLRDQLGQLTKSNSKLMDENDMLRSRVIYPSSNPRYSMISSTSTPINIQASFEHSTDLKRSHTTASDGLWCDSHNENSINDCELKVKYAIEYLVVTQSSCEFTTSSNSQSMFDESIEQKPSAQQLSDEQCKQNMNEEYVQNYKIIFIGDSSVGKTSLIRGICGYEFCPFAKATLGIDFFSKKVKIDEDVITFQFWDTAGQERFRCLSRSYYRRANAVVLVYDLSNHRSFKNARTWLDEIELVSTTTPTLLVANKLDLRSEQDDQMISRLCGAQLAQSIGASFIEVSARTGLNVHNIIPEIINIAKTYRPQYNHHHETDDVDLIKQKSSTKSKRCC